MNSTIMKNFIFDEYENCINPNRTEGGDKEFFFEIQTAYHNGVWYHGHRYWVTGHKCDWPVYINSNGCNTEREAIIKEICFLIKDLQNDITKRILNMEVPQKVFKELNDLKAKYTNPQLTLF